MTAIRFKPPTDLPSKKQLKAFETELGYTLPADYRKFLLTQNGGGFEEYYSIFIEECGEEFLVHAFMKVGGPRALDISATMYEIGDELPEGFIFIATDYGGNLFIMDLSEEETTPVYYFDRYRKLPESVEYNTYEVADSFTEFLSMIKRWERPK